MAIAISPTNDDHERFRPFTASPCAALAARLDDAVDSPLFDLAAAPFAAFGRSLLDYVPSLFFVIGIGAVTWGAIRFVKIVFRQIETGTLAIDNFPDDWAAPTYRLVRLLDSAP
jgi:hypothetical protein